MDREEEIEINAYSVFVQDKGWCARVQEKELERLGYRKADEVRKETAKEIIAKLTDDLACIEYPPERQLIKGYIEIFMKQYDLEASK